MGTGGVPFEKSVADILEAFKKCDGVVTKTAEYLGCCVQTIYSQMKKHPELKDALDASRAHYDTLVLDKAEKGIVDLLEEKDNSAIFYTLNMRGHDRQWIHPSIRASQLQDGMEKIQSMLDELLKLQKQNFVLQEENVLLREEVSRHRNVLSSSVAPLQAIADKSQSNDPDS